MKRVRNELETGKEGKESDGRTFFLTWAGRRSRGWPTRRAYRAFQEDSSHNSST